MMWALMGILLGQAFLCGVILYAVSRFTTALRRVHESNLEVSARLQKETQALYALTEGRLLTARDAAGRIA